MKNERSFIYALAFLAIITNAYSSKVLAESNTVWSKIKANPETSTFAKYAHELGLSDALDTRDLIVPWTVFVPENEAFKRLPPAIKSRIETDEIFRRSLITSHLVLGANVSADGIGTGNQLTTASGLLLDLIQKDQLYVKDVVVTKRDLVGSNGVIHLVECVMYVQPSQNDDRLDSQTKSAFASTACCLADSVNDMHHISLVNKK